MSRVAPSRLGASSPCAPRRASGALALLAAAALAACGGSSRSDSLPLPTFHPDPAAIAVAGPSVPGVERFDAAVKGLLVRWNLAGASIAVARDGKLILARSYGYADFAAQTPTAPASRFRIGSISKVLTALAVLQLADAHAVDLDAPFLDALPGYPLPVGADPRLRDVTVRELLHHAGGWDRSRSPDYVQWQERIAGELGVPSPATSEQIVRWALGKPLDFAPGTAFAYSNLGYVILARVIEAASGQTYEHRVRDHLLAPMGVLGLSIGDGQAAGRQAAEVSYYDTLLLDSAFPGEGEVPAPYAWSLDSADGAGGWISTAADLTRLFGALDASSTTPPLSQALMSAVFADPYLPANGSGEGIGIAGLPGVWHYGLGLFVRSDAPGEYWHGGSYMGTQAALGRTGAGEVYAILVNGREESSQGQVDFTAELNALLPEAIAAGSFGSADDLYPLVPSQAFPPHGA